MEGAVSQASGPAPVPITGNHQVTIHVLSCSGLDGLDRGGTSDPYVKIRFPGNKEEWKKTKVIKKNCNPVWENERFSYTVDGPFEVEVWDHNTIKHDKKLGHITFKFSDNDLIQAGFPICGKMTEITRNLEDGHGTIKLGFEPHYGSGQGIEEKGREESKLWEEHTFEVKGGTIKMKLPSSMGNLEDGAIGSLFMSFLPEREWLTGTSQGIMGRQGDSKQVSDKASLDEAMNEYLEQLKGMGATLLGERGECKVSGGDDVWATMTNPYAGGYIQTTILYMFGVGGFATTISFIGYMKTWGQDKIPQEEIVEHIYRGYAKTFMHILESITIA